MTELAGVARTAVTVAAARARETAREDRLFDDPFAKRFEGPAGPSFWMPGSDPAEVIAAHGDYFALRTRFFDTYLQQAAKPQVVILGAGVDTRAYRLDWPAGTTIFEIDLASVLDYKANVLADVEPRCRRVAVAADLTGDWSQALRDNGFQHQDTAWLAEGLLMYLGDDHVHRLLSTALELSPPGSTLAAEHFGFSLDAQRLDSVAGVDAGRLAPATSAPEVLTRAGWTVTAERDIPGLAHEHGRPVPPRWAEGSERAERTRLLTARRAPA